LGIKENLDNLRKRVENAAKKAGRNPDEIKIVAASKEVPAEKILEAIECGISIIGENRVQEAYEKYNKIGHLAEWHMIGHLQRNKVKKALLIFDCIQSVDSERLAQEISKRATKPVDIFIEVNTSLEETKYGVLPEDVIDFINKIRSLERLRIKGLMTIGPLKGDPRPCFRKLRELRDKIMEQGFENVDIQYLSMGMTDDFEIAIEEGSNMIRIGRAIFGERRGGGTYAS